MTVLGVCVSEHVERGVENHLEPCRIRISNYFCLGTYAWYVDARAIWRFERIRKRDARQFVAVAFQLGLLRQFLVAALPRSIGRIEHALQRMTGDTEFCAMIG